MNNLYCYKSIPLKVKDIDTKQGIVSGYFSAFGMPDSDGDIIRKGAYAKTIQERGPKSNNPRIKHLLDHDTTKAIGVIQELSEDDYGLLYVSKMGSHTLGRDALLMIQDGIITEHSVGFKTVRENKSGEFNEISEILLWEGSSLQAWGANQYTPITGVKSAQKPTSEALFTRLDALTKALRGSYSDETIQLFEIEYNQVKQAISDLLTVAPPIGTQTAELNEDKAILEVLKSYKIN